MGSLLLFLAAVSSLLAPPRTQLISQRCSLPRCGPPHPAQCSSEPPELSCVLQAAGVASSPERVTQLTSGFCNAVYLVEMAREQQIGGERIVVVKLFSPLAKLRLSPAERGMGDLSASDAGLGPRVLFRCEDGLITHYMDGMRDLTEMEVHAAGSDRLICAIATRLAKLHSLPLRDQISLGDSPSVALTDDPIALWRFMARMLERIDRAPESLPPGISVVEIRGAVDRMRRCVDALDLPVIYGHGDLKPSNVMSSADDTQVQFIDFELAGAHYRGYDLHKIFRTGLPATEASQKNIDLFLKAYMSALRGAGSLKHNGAASPAIQGFVATEQMGPTLEELQGEAAASEPLTWLEAAVFFWFATVEYPSQANEWGPLALDRWNNYLATAHKIEEGGVAAVMLERARRQRRGKGTIATSSVD